MYFPQKKSLIHSKTDFLYKSKLPFFVFIGETSNVRYSLDSENLTFFPVSATEDDHNDEKSHKTQTTKRHNHSYKHSPVWGSGIFGRKTVVVK